MDPTFDAFLRSWPFDPWFLISLLLTACVYLRGWRVLRRRDPDRWPARRPAAFLAGLGTLFLALASPIETFTSLLLQVHMLQHLLLMMIAPPLLWLGAPLFPLLLGLPRSIRVYWAAPLFRSRVLRRAFRWLTNPVPAWLLFAAATWIWHLPPTYDLALASDTWHYVQHICFLVTALLFWYPVVRPFPSRPRWSSWLLIPYLILADVQNTLLAAWLTFAGTPLYGYYVDRPRLGNLSALEDQTTAGVLMWVPGSLVYLIPLFVIGVRLLFGGSGRPHRRLKPIPMRTKARAAPTAYLALPVIGQPRTRIEPAAFDLLRVPLLGRFLRLRHARVCLQVPLLLLALAIVFDGFFGPPIAGMNLAGVLPWIHWRGFVVLGLLASGNVFCMACPFMLPREIARRFRSATLTWPPWLRNKWPAVVLLVLFLWAYEAFALWDSPPLTAAIVLAYFAAAFSIDALFRGASFCKYVCPIGQFNFVQSLVSPLEVKVRELGVCSSCRTKDCIRGRDEIHGCELGLFQPRKSSNMDCTFCLDCIHACPHQNIGIIASMPGTELWHASRRSGVGRFSRRIDLAVLSIVLVAGAYSNAALMTEPLLDLQEHFTSASGLRSPLFATSALCLLALVLLPCSIVGVTAVVSRWWGRSTETATAVATHFAYALVPLGFGMWLAHFSFHFLTSYEGIIPTVQRFLADRGSTFLGSPDWSCTACIPAPAWLLRLEIMFLDLGLLLSLYTGYRIARSRPDRMPQPLRAFAPWAILIGLLFALGIWIVFQPMQMRGTMQMTG
jgi:cytochrome c oxidase assembly factor CtaG/ferredoxin